MKNKGEYDDYGKIRLATSGGETINHSDNNNQDNSTSTVDKETAEKHYLSMNQMTREELDARLQLSEAKADGRLDRFDERINLSIKHMENSVDRVEASVDLLKNNISNLKSTVVITGISSVLAIFLGVGAFNATVLSNMVASFDSGRSVSNELNLVSNQVARTAELLEKIQKEQSERLQHNTQPPK